ncbi:helicase [Ornithobacterium rhinotracheale]|uniref:AAA family ATPase n=1 Tax=Ornithobacterium rhinotracheale TaxID=28251 RepID=UPI00129D1534|nr:AAA family ATPase [Ornithobacterium rhinotracheale]MRJ07351.1 helicase [Ornithobacterium rhinotracheale]UOH77952.1 AAA family ATPase [Ornithobacterium rhinotracheale]
MTQEKALALLKSGRNVFLTGSAGTGKTYTLNKYIEYLKSHKIPVAITASTGIAATHLNGMTVHSWSGIGIKNHMDLSHLQKLKEKKYMRDKMKDVRVLIIDEVSMLHKHQLNAVNDVLQYFKDNTQPFGGIQVVFSGDFFQLPPIGEEWEESRDKFCFMSAAWVDAKPFICYLTEQHRQSNNPLNQLLNEMRAGEVSPLSYDMVNEKIQETMYSDINRFPQLYTHNADVDKINQQKLKLLDTLPEKFTATAKGNKSLIETMKNNILAPFEFELKKGAEVMFVKNNFEKKFFNGTLGVVKEFSDEGYPVVETRDGDFIVAEPEEWKVEDENGKTLASIEQVPLRLAWAITVHKSQGMTLDEACVDLRKTFEKGQGYVALSRLRSMDGLTLLGVNDIAMQLDELAFKADRRFLELSDWADDTFSIEDLEIEHIPFIVKCGGQIKPVKRLSKTDKKKKGVKNSHIITKKMFEEGLTPEEIAKERDCTMSTVYGHLMKLKEQFPDMEIASRIKCDNEIVERVREIVQTSTFKDGDNKTIKIYNKANKEIPFTEIQKAILLV